MRFNDYEKYEFKHHFGGTVNYCFAFSEYFRRSWKRSAGEVI